MAISISTKLRDTIAEGIGNAGSGIQFNSGKLRAWDGSAPSVNAAPTGTLLIDVALPADAFGAVSSGVISKAGTWEDTSANATGTPTYFRLTRSTDDDGATGATYERIQGSAGVGSGDLNFNGSLTAGQAVTISTFTVTMPAS